ncbi:alpha-methylacyl-CoA racemase [Capsaspora owczarzaki ATCC 30864]|nr:alpha-methylacyl-CoA racemase [Capsaspora owczarzaki ATCC 30864]|eukprot:XP_004365096.1 alpha-methylacyl-CoA racemase [Capsaspora owczarzaki ATCC 30864]
MALRGLKVIEMAGLAPAPFAGLVLADFGANVIRVDKLADFSVDRLSRGKQSVSIDLKSPRGAQAVRDLCKNADVLIEPFRPGVMERLGLGPDDLLKTNPRLIYARLTGYGQTGKLAQRAGHDINYVAVSGVLSALGRRHENPAFPGNLVGDFAGGSLMCVIGILTALQERARSGKGQVIDAAMVDGASYLASFVYGVRETGMWDGPRGTNLLDGGAPFYETYKTKDGKYMAVGSIEPQFYRLLLQGLGLDGDSTLPEQLDKEGWPQLKERFTQIFASKSQAEWCAIFDHTDACVTPVNELDDPLTDANSHGASRGILYRSEEGVMPVPAPRLSREGALDVQNLTMPRVGQHTVQALTEAGISPADVAKLLKDGIINDASGAAKL